MGQVFVTFGRVDNQRTVPAYAPQATTHEIESTSSAAVTSGGANAGDYARVVNAGLGVVWVAFGQAPTAAVLTGFPVPAGGAIDIGPLAAGDKASVIDDS